MHKRANQSLHKINEYYGRRSIIAVHIATAPSTPVEGVLSSANSLLKSMEEILSWDWQGAEIVIEHCDTAVNGRNYEKGFLPLKDEIKTLLKIRKIFDVGITINWARSAIEGRSVDTPLEHLKLLSINKLLSGLMFSGVSKNDRKYGSWKDNHMPFSQPSICVNNDFFEKNSLLTQKNITSTLGEIDVNNLDYLGIKILAMPIDKSSIKTRVGYNKTAISTIEESLKSLNRGYTHK